MKTTLAKKVCRECGCPVLVAETLPHPDITSTTGMPATRWDADRQREYFVGWVCEACAFGMVGEGKPGAISGGGGEGLGLEFHY